MEATSATSAECGVSRQSSVPGRCDLQSVGVVNINMVIQWKVG